MFSLNERNTIHVEELSRIADDVWYIKSESGHVIHIALNGITFCYQSLTSYWERTITNIDNICQQCVFRTRYLSIPESPSKYYQIYWRCTAIAVKKGKGKKVKRCSNCSRGPYESFCTIHSKCFLKYINKYISVSPDVSKLIYKLL